jgi:AcrR family transcriptional regulator
MVRWEPGTRQRLHAAAVELFATRGFEQTTAAEIARSVGLTERTFFRHFADKREVLFAGQEEFVGTFVDAIAGAPPEAGPMELVAAALGAVVDLFPDQRRAEVRTRQSVIDANPALREREQHKLAGLAVAMAGALRDRGVAEPAATLAARSGATVFTVAFAQWIAPHQQRSLTDLIARTFDELVRLTTAGGWPGLSIGQLTSIIDQHHRQ